MEVIVEKTKTTMTKVEMENDEAMEKETRSLTFVVSLRSRPDNHWPARSNAWHVIDKVHDLNIVVEWRHIGRQSLSRTM
jgi:hypothetical protein